MQTTRLAQSRAGAPGASPAGYRYGAVLVLTVALLVLLIAAPATDWARAATLTLQLAALLVVVATSRARAQTRRRRALALFTASTLLVLGTGTGVLPVTWALATGAALAAIVPAALVGGVVRLLREHGVTREAIAGALAIYLLVGNFFAAVIGVVARAGAGAYFAQGGDGTTGDRVYFSFATLTTTGYGDFTARTGVGHALAVLEMLAGQLYLVTVIGLLVGSLASRRRT